ncbi:MAG TPA: PfaD family polyunsaturated fatty acid/polyketide biosynthesis protein [Magnetospirillaceae bacterium]|jgi:PfaD family protein
MSTQHLPLWESRSSEIFGPAFGGPALVETIRRIREPVWVVRSPDGLRLGLRLGGAPAADAVANLPAIYPEWLGERAFLEAHAVRFPYVVGEMARGIATADMVIAAGGAGLLGFFGAAGLALPEIERNLHRIAHAASTKAWSWGSNLIHSPTDPALEAATADLYVRCGVRRVSASAFMALSPSVVRYAFHGVRIAPDGTVTRANSVFAKVSRPEVAAQFMAPPPAAMLDTLVANGALTAQEAEIARHLPVAEDIIAEADSGGHTDNRPLPVLIPLLMAERDRAMQRFGYARAIRVGAAGGIGSPAAVASALALGAAFVCTGSVNQACVESGLSESARAMLAEASSTDVAMAPSADMFELGVKVQVLKKGTMFAMRAQRLYDIYHRAGGLDDLSAEERGQLERDIFRAPLDQIWNETRDYFAARDPAQVERAAREPRHKMALVFRWYLGRSSRWPIEGAADRRLDYQMWCGPAMGAFNDWAAGSFLAAPANRTVVQVARNLLEGAAVCTRAQHCRAAGLAVPTEAFHFSPRPLT